MSATIKTKAIVINSLRYGESDLVMTFLTEGHGLVKGLAKGALKSRKRFAGSLEPFTLIELGCRLKPDMLARVDSADIICPNYGIRDNLDRIRAASCVAELAALLEPPAPEQSEAFRTVAAALRAIDGSGRPMELMAFFLVRYLSVAGFGISTDRCARCGGVIAGGPAGYSGGDGLLCGTCAGPGAMTLSPGLLAFIKRAGSADEEGAGRLRISAGALREFVRFARAYLRTVSGREPRSFAALEPPSLA